MDSSSNVSNRSPLQPRQHLATDASHQEKPRVALDGNTKKLFGNAISGYLKKLYTKSGIQGNPVKSDAIKKINAILDHLPNASKKILSAYHDNINIHSANSRKQFVDKFVQLTLKTAFKNAVPYSQDHQELLNKKVIALINRSFNNEESLQKNGSEATNILNSSLRPSADTQRNTGSRNPLVTRMSTGVGTTEVSSTSDGDQKIADDKLQAIKDAKVEFQAKYQELVDRLHTAGSLLNLTKSYSALHDSKAKYEYYSDTSIVLGSDTEKQQKQLAQMILNVVGNSRTDAHNRVISYLMDKGILPGKAGDMRSYFLDKFGNLPADANSFLKMILSPKQDNLYTAGGKTATEILQFRHLVFKGLTVIEKDSANQLFNPTDSKQPGILPSKLNKINKMIDDYNDFLKQHHDVVGAKFFTKMTFNEATGGFVMFSTFVGEYNIAEADRQAGSLQSEGYAKTLAVLHEISDALESKIGEHTDSDTDNESYLSGLTSKQLAYLKSLVLVKGGKSIGEEYLDGDSITSSISRGTIRGVHSQLNAVIKDIEDKNQKVSVSLQDATEKRNVAATTLSKFLDKIYDIYKLLLQ